MGGSFRARLVEEVARKSPSKAVAVATPPCLTKGGSGWIQGHYSGTAVDTASLVAGARIFGARNDELVSSRQQRPQIACCAAVILAGGGAARQGARREALTEAFMAAAEGAAGSGRTDSAEIGASLLSEGLAETTMYRLSSQDGKFLNFMEPDGRDWIAWPGSFFKQGTVGGSSEKG